MKRTYSILGVLTSFLIISACGSTNQSMISEAPVQQNQEVNERVSAEDLEAKFFERRHEAKMNFVQADVDFMLGMIGHHAQALIMSALAEPNEASPSVQTLAARIINAQRDEINSMQRWLATRDQMVPQVEIDGLNLIITAGKTPSLKFDAQNVAASVAGMNEKSMDMHEGHSMNDMEMAESSAMEMEDHSMMDHSSHQGMMHDHSNMPGMLTQTQLEELATAKGSEFDNLFLRYMIQHHSGAITMVNDLVNADGAAQEREVGKLAAEINVDQITEIERMRTMLMQDF